MNNGQVIGTEVSNDSLSLRSLARGRDAATSRDRRSETAEAVPCGVYLVPKEFAVTLPVENPFHIVVARQAAFDFATRLGFSSADRNIITTAVSEIGRNVLQHSQSVGQIALATTSSGKLTGMFLRVSDRGCGMARSDSRAHPAGSMRSLGAGLRRTKETMDVFRVETSPGVGTTVIMVKWLREAGR